MINEVREDFILILNGACLILSFSPSLSFWLELQSEALVIRILNENFEYIRFCLLGYL